MSFQILLFVCASIVGFAMHGGTSSQDGGSRRTQVDRLVVYEPTHLPGPGETVPVGRRPALEAVKIGDDLWLSGNGRITTPLPVGYPAPTAPGAIELKSYPSIRRAEVGGSILPDLSSNLGFWKLFRHIKSRGIAMTAPVEMEYRSLDLSGSRDDGSWSMAFLYREPSLGPTGVSGDVTVVDSNPTVFLSVGALGSYGIDDSLRVLETLKQALTEMAHHEAAGSVRVLHYNGPDVPNGRRWFEVQVPVRRKSSQ